jgi:NADPH:quinone reductase-like Zn-dependent oxidoreductase
VEVRVAALNPVDLKIASGTFYGARPAPPYVPGSEGMGVVRASQSWSPGTRVRFGASRPGGLAEVVAVPDDALVAVPDEVEDAVAGGIGVAGLAAWGSLHAGNLVEGDRVLVLGAAGVVGRLAIQSAVLLGAARVVAAGRDTASLQELVELGANAVVTLGEEESAAGAEAIVEAAGGQVDVIVDPLAGKPALTAAMAAAPGGRLVNLGDAAGETLEFPAALLRSKSLVILGYTNFALSLTEQRSALEALLGHAGAGRLRLACDVVPLDQVADAWERQRTSPRRRLVVKLA